MASRRHQRQKACGTKQRFASREAATRGLAALYRTRGLDSGALVVYGPCRQCGAFHFGHEPTVHRRKGTDARCR
mgnify:CR=1 FL=1